MHHWSIPTYATDPMQLYRLNCDSVPTVVFYISTVVSVLIVLALLACQRYLLSMFLSEVHPTTFQIKLNRRAAKMGEVAG